MPLPFAEMVVTTEGGATLAPALAQLPRPLVEAVVTTEGCAAWPLLFAPRTLLFLYYKKTSRNGAVFAHLQYPMFPIFSFVLRLVVSFSGPLLLHMGGCISTPSDMRSGSSYRFRLVSHDSSASPQSFLLLFRLLASSSPSLPLVAYLRADCDRCCPCVEFLPQLLL